MVKTYAHYCYLVCSCFEDFLDVSSGNTEDKKCVSAL